MSFIMPNSMEITFERIIEKAASQRVETVFWVRDHFQLRERYPMKLSSWVPGLSPCLNIGHADYPACTSNIGMSYFRQCRVFSFSMMVELQTSVNRVLRLIPRHLISGMVVELLLKRNSGKSWL